MANLALSKYRPSHLGLCKHPAGRGAQIPHVVGEGPGGVCVDRLVD